MANQQVLAVAMILTPDVIEGFVKTCLLSGFNEPVPTPEVHREWWNLCCSKNRFVAIAAPRGFAKSTAITHSYTLAATLFRERKFVVLVSDTETQAIMFLADLKNELATNEKIQELFLIKRDREGRVEFAKETETDIIVELEDGYQFRIIARGAGQRVRGIKWGSRRPDLIVGDDLENDEIVLNSDRRDKFKRWFYGALLPIRSDNGIVRVVGTILHMDSLLENLMPGRQLAAVQKQKQLIIEPLKEYTLYRLPWKSIRYRAHDKDWKTYLWEEKRDEGELRRIRQDYVAQGIPEVYAQEYLNVPLDETFAYFRKNDFLPMTPDDRLKKKNFFIAMDLAISEDERADYTVAVVGGMDDAGYLHIVDVIRDRIDGRQIVDLIIHLQNHYKAIFFGVEEEQIKRSIWAFLKESMILSQSFPSFQPLKNMGKDKMTRARSIQGRIRAHTVKFDKEANWYQDFEDELCRFPRDKHDDQVDAFAWLGQMIDKLIIANTPQEDIEEEYATKYAKSGLHESGRSATTGY